MIQEACLWPGLVLRTLTWTTSHLSSGPSLCCPMWLYNQDRDRGALPPARAWPSHRPDLAPMPRPFSPPGLGLGSFCLTLFCCHSHQAGNGAAVVVCV